MILEIRREGFHKDLEEDPLQSFRTGEASSSRWGWPLEKS
jgi:hypothetical protein